MIHSVGSPALWGAFLAFVAVFLALDLGVFNRKPHEITVKEAAVWSAVWVSLALAFNVFVGLKWGWHVGQQFLTGYLIEKALSVDNLFVFYVIFAAFRIPLRDQHRVLFWGIVGALVLRAAMVLGGTALLAHFAWVVYVFGGVLIATGAKMLVRREEEVDLSKSRAYRFVQRAIPATKELRDSRMFVRENGALRATPMLLALVVIELLDVVFAIDSILAIFAITLDPFIVFTSNIFAVLGLRSLYFVLASVARRFEYLQPGLALILIFVGIKLAVSRFIHVPIIVSLLVVALLLAGSIALSLHKEARDRRAAGGLAP
ncbi:MAG: TerC family protein [Deltaproteobacteria bacterium]|nr:TerC family protein [Deltaproteobacteria bacterium]MCW5802350.1 TerC family protein [Deltaproteobacteria bacterium]